MRRMKERILGLFSRRKSGARRERLVREYFLISVALIGGGLIMSGLIEIYYRYHESRDQLARLQKEIAAGAAYKIEHFVLEIHNILKGATKSRDIAPKGLTADFRFELEKLLLIAPAVTEAMALNENGLIQVQASRLRTVLPDAKKDLSRSPPFQRAREGKSYYGPVYFVRGSEPYMTIAVPIERFAGDVIGVLQAEVNLKYIGDVVSSITIGKAGYAYAVTRAGELIAHPDISLVLQRRSVESLAVVKSAFESSPGPNAVNAMVAANIQGKEVLSSFALIKELDWAVIVDLPVEEAYEALYSSILRTSTLFLIGLGMSLIASFFLARRVVQPMRVLREGVERIGTGDLGYRLELKTGDEIEVLADEFNRMTSQLQESYANLEQKVEDRTHELTESLAQQTATSEILGVIASSPTDVQPVLDVVAQRAARLCEAEDAIIFRVIGEHHQRVAKFGTIPAPDFPVPITRGFPGGRAIIDRQTIHIHDIEAELDTEYADVKAIQKTIGQRTVLATPLLREGSAIGAIVIRRLHVRPFSEKQIALLRTFADQAVIAIENVRLFQELESRNREITESLEQQTATSEILGVIASSPSDLQPVYQIILQNITRLCESNIAALFIFDGEVLSTAASYGTTPEFAAHLKHSQPRPSHETTTRLAALERRTVHVLDLLSDPTFSPTPLGFYKKENVRTVISVPLLRENSLVGVITTWRREIRAFTDKQIALLKTFADQAVIAIENVRLFQEIQEKNLQLETANRHKSQFLANVSHELRTPLNSIIGFTRIVLRRSEGKLEPLQKENLQKVLVSSDHLLNLINELLDLAKIEAGRMEAFVETFRLDDIVRMATTTVESLLRNGRVKLLTDIAPDIPPLKTDRDKLKQSVINLLSNAVKFTEQGEVKVAAWRDNGFVKLTVSDTGIGMSQEALRYIFDEFRQADMSSTRKYGGTGLGLAIVKKFINLMGGEIIVDSEEGKGSTFTITLPMELKQGT
ncbi:MAG TPA: GAF domain-containing protein [Candidatus Binatia bacterium]|nr:GAF domain-containing protein [Candidatus Binatia bacterium]